MAQLILIKHSLPEIVPAVPASEWQLSDEGRQRCYPLAEILASRQPNAIVASLEPKAVETGQIVASRLDLPFATAENLHEHDRRGEPFGTQEDFAASVKRFLAQPGELVYGTEMADEVYDRFARAVRKVVEAHTGRTVAIVAHGTAITLFVSRHNPDVEPFSFWQRLGLPSFAALTLPKFELAEVVETVVQ